MQPAALRTTELTLMLVQLEACGRGAAALPDWAAAEYLQRGWVKALGLGARGVNCTLYAAIRAHDEDLLFMRDFLEMEREGSQAVFNAQRP